MKNWMVPVLILSLILPAPLYAAPLEPVDCPAPDAERLPAQLQLDLETSTLEEFDEYEIVEEEGEIVSWPSPIAALASDRLRQRRALNQPTETSETPNLGINQAIKPFGGCRRLFIYRGKKYPIDSNFRQDGEKLRPLLRNLPEASRELDTYQKNRLVAKTSAYVGTVGLVLTVATLLFGDQLGEGSRDALKRIGIFGGLGIAGAGFIYSFGMMRSNETHLNNAVNTYNAAHPRDPLELQFSTGILF